MKEIIFISVPYSQNPERGIELSKLGGKYVRMQGKIPFSPVLNFRHFYDNGNEYDTVLEDCKAILARCDEALFIKTEAGFSKGQNIEYAAVSGNIPCKIVNYEIVQAFVELKGPCCVLSRSLKHEGGLL